MSLPTYEQYLQSAATWRREHQGIAYTLSHHGASNYSPQGTWCFYIHLLEEAFQRPEDFALFDREPVVKPGLGEGSYREGYDYADVPDHGFHGGITFYGRSFYVQKHTGQRLKALKIGCDYAHFWDREDGYWQGLDAVDCDAKALIDKLVLEYPQKTRCGYSGRYDMPDQYYTARNGALIHKSHVGHFSEDEWPAWLPADPADGPAA